MYARICIAIDVVELVGVLPRREDPADLRRHQPDPAHGDRAQLDQGLRRARSPQALHSERGPADLPQGCGADRAELGALYQADQPRRDERVAVAVGVVAIAAQEEFGGWGLGQRVGAEGGC